MGESDFPTEKCFHLEYRMLAVKLPGRDEQFSLVAVRGFGEEPLLLLRNVALQLARKSLWAIVQGYIARWLLDEALLRRA